MQCVRETNVQNKFNLIFVAINYSKLNNLSSYLLSINYREKFILCYIYRNSCYLQKCFDTTYSLTLNYYRKNIKIFYVMSQDKNNFSTKGQNYIHHLLIRIETEINFTKTEII